MQKINEKFLLIMSIALPILLFLFILVTILVCKNNASKIYLQNAQNQRINEQSKISQTKEPVKIWFSASDKNLKKGQNFDLNIYIDTKGETMAVFAFDFALGDNFTVDTSSGADGISKAVDSSNFIIMSNPDDVLSNHFRFSGICAQNCVNGNKKHIAVIHAKALNDFSLEDVSNQLSIKELADELGNAIDF